MTKTFNRLEDFDESIKDSYQRMEGYLNAGDEFSEFVNFLITTQELPHSFIVEEHAHRMMQLESFVTFLDIIYHAVYDDGDITFVKINNKPRMAFLDSSNQDLRSYVMDSMEKYLEDRGKNYEIEILDCTLSEFADMVNESHRKHIKRCFISDAKRMGVNVARNYYLEYDCFDEKWCMEI